MEDVKPGALPEGTLLSSGKRDYKVVKVLGSGGFGVTYLVKGNVKADNVWVEGSFAVKEHFPSSFATRRGDAVVPTPGHEAEFNRALQDFILEATRLQKFGTQHENIVKVNEIFEANGTAYYVMQHVNGMSLTDYARSMPEGRLDRASALTVLDPIFSAIEFLHSNRVNHFDIKPDNIMLHQTEQGLMPVLIDFGLSIHFRKNGDKTTPKEFYGLSEGYAPIEQYAEINAFSPASDVYALAATLVFLLTGHIPEAAPKLKISYLRQYLSDITDQMTVEAICRAMEPDNERRTQSVAQFRVDLGLVPSLGNGGTLPMDFKPGKPTRPISDGNGFWHTSWVKYTLATVGAAAVALIVFLGVRWMATPAEDQGAPTENPETVAVQGSAEGSQEPTQVPVETPENTPEGNIDPAVEPQRPATPEPSGSSPASLPQRPAQPQTPAPAVTNGTLSFPYGSYTGEIKGGKPHGRGTVRFTSSHTIEHTSVQASAGDYMNGSYSNGELITGKLYNADGELLKTIIP